jgi:elongation factor 1-beta
MRVHRALTMGDVACIIRVMPESPEVDLEALKVTLKEMAPEIHEIQEQPIGFGLKALMIVAVVGDKGGQTDRLEELLSSAPGVERAEIVEVTLT